MKHFYFLSLFFLCSLQASAHAHINLYLSLTPGIGLSYYNAERGFGMGVSVHKKPIETSGNVNFWSAQYRRYSPAYTELKLDFFIGRSKVPRRYKFNPFIYAYLGNGKAEFAEWVGSSSNKVTTVVEYSKVSYGAGMNFFLCLTRNIEASACTYFFAGLAIGKKDLMSKSATNPNFSDGSLNHVALRLNLGFVFSLNNN